MWNKVKSWLERSISGPFIQTGAKEELSLNREVDVPPAAGNDLVTRKGRRKVMFIIALPIIFQNIVQHLQMVIDRAFLGKLDPGYLSALGNVMTPYNALSLFLIASSTGLTILVANHIGAGKPEKARNLAESSFIYASLFSFLIFLFWHFGSDQVFTLLGTGGEVKKHAVQYVKIMAISLLFMGADTTAAATLQGVGVTLPILITGVIKNILNIILDWLLIYGNLGFPAMGMQGAAIATLISNAVGSVFLVVYVLVTKKLPFHFTLQALIHPRFKQYWKTMRLGLPTGLESLLWFVGQLFLTRMVNILNPLAMGTVSLVQGIYMLGLFIYLGFARAATTIVGQLDGSGRQDQVRPAGFQAQWISLAVSMTWSLVLLIFPGWLAAFFTKDSTTLRESIQLLRIAAVFINFQAVNVIMGHAIRGTGDTKWMLYTQIGGTLFVLGFSYLVMFQLGMGLTGLFITLMLDEFLRGAINTWRFWKGRNPFSRNTVSDKGFTKKLHRTN